MRNRSVLTTKSQVTIPKSVREFLGIGPGRQVEFEIEEGKAVIIPVPSEVEKHFGSVKPREKTEDFKRVRETAARKLARDIIEEDP